MKKILVLILLVSFTVTAIAQNYTTNRGSGTIMISGTGTYSTILDQEYKSSEWDLGIDGALFLFPQLAAGLEFGYKKTYTEEPSMAGDPIEIENIGKYFGPRVYFFLGGRKSQLTPFVKGGANYLLRNRLIDGEEVWENQNELGLTASAGVLLNLAKNVGLSIETEYNFEKGTAVEDIDTKQLLIKFGIRSFLAD